MKKLKLIRGQRILNQLNETSFNTLRRNIASIPAGDREQSSNEVHLVKMELTPYQDSNSLQVESTTNHDGNQYVMQIMFEDVIYEDSDQGDNITFTGSDGEQHNILPIKLSKNNVKVKCTCLDFYWRFASFNSSDDSLIGKAPPPYTKTSNRQPVNPDRVPGVCKHLLTTADALKQSGVVTD